MTRRQARLFLVCTVAYIAGLLALSTCSHAQDERYPVQVAQAGTTGADMTRTMRHPAPLPHKSDCSVVDAYAREAGVPVHIGRAVIRHESGCNPAARNKRSGATGLGQLMPNTARGLGYRGSREGLHDVATNLRLSMRYLAMAIRRGGAGCAGIGLYERGVGARPVCTAYGRAVLGRAS